ncbi:hypothetical protein AXFE_15560 [Acidithrix ferrooxidans]|uniref:Uncharacterized protein n=1 Tax=Acidithrix ferrooxidans TaxID=1280514 RepID=A0A0D8HI90_9ACTN|nr:hypothetical protein AXFE_15560 [Acidithrix ferrooxidans]
MSSIDFYSCLDAIDCFKKKLRGCGGSNLLSANVLGYGGLTTRWAKFYDHLARFHRGHRHDYSLRLKLRKNEIDQRLPLPHQSHQTTDLDIALQQMKILRFNREPIRYLKGEMPTGFPPT